MAFERTLTFPWEPEVHTPVVIVGQTGTLARVRLTNSEGETLEIPVQFEWLS